MSDTDMLYMASLEKRNEELEAKLNAEWLTDYKELKNSIGAVKLKDMKEAVGLLQELNTENDQLTSQLLEAKRLLKLAIEDFAAIAEVHAAATPILCPQYGKYLKAVDVRTRKWHYADEALALIGEDTNVPAREDGEQDG